MDDEKGRPSGSELRASLLGALAHELRTPLTSLGMLLDLARRQASETGRAELDAELLRMFELSLRELQRLADGVQEVSRIERGMWQLQPREVTLGEIVERIRALASTNVQLVTDEEGLSVPVTLDVERAAEALADFAITANRLGAGSGSVALDAKAGTNAVVLRLRSGEPAGPPLAFGTDAGFRYYRALSVIVLMGGSVEAQRNNRYVEIAVRLPTGGG